MNHHLEGLFDAIRKVDGEDLRLAEHVACSRVYVYRGPSESHDSLGCYRELPSHGNKTELLLINLLDYDLV
jgi:hypothetical protein